jgi:hypothetical protein
MQTEIIYRASSDGRNWPHDHRQPEGVTARQPRLLPEAASAGESITVELKVV